MPELMPIDDQVLTLKAVFEDFKKYRKLKTGTTDYYEKILRIHLEDWLYEPISAIDREQVLMRHHFITCAAGPTSANVAMRVLSAILNYAMFRYRGSRNLPPINENPVTALTQLRAWNKLKPQHRYIKREELAQWYLTVSKVKSDNLKDSLLLMLFNGARRNEINGLKWSDVDCVARSFTLVDPKNRRDHTLPMSSFVYQTFLRRQSQAKTEWVFPNKDGTGPMSNSSTSYERVSMMSGVKFSPHDLRRTFVNVARTAKLDHYAIKQILNHAGYEDVTFRCYTSKEVDDLREPMERVCYAMQMYLGMRPTGHHSSVRVLEPQLISFNRIDEERDVQT